MELKRIIPLHESLPDTKYKFYRYVRASTAQTVSAKRTLQVCHEIISVRNPNPMGETVCEISQGNLCELGSLPNTSDIWGHRRELGKTGTDPGKAVASPRTNSRLQYSC
jgi:hypothetical protein